MHHRVKAGLCIGEKPWVSISLPIVTAQYECKQKVVTQTTERDPNVCTSVRERGHTFVSGLLPVYILLAALPELLHSWCVYANPMQPWVIDAVSWTG